MSASPIHSSKSSTVSLNTVIKPETSPAPAVSQKPAENTKILAYARLDFSNFTFYIQTLQVLLGRRLNGDQSHSVDVHLGPRKAVSRKHARIFYNFGTQRFEILVLGRNGLFIDNDFFEKGITMPLSNGNRIQIGQVLFTFVLPEGSEIEPKLDNVGEASSINNEPIAPNDTATNNNNDTLTSMENMAKESPNDTTAVLQLLKTEIKQQDPKQKLIPKKTPVKKEKKPTKPPKKVYSLEEIPEEYRTKPSPSYSNIIIHCLKTYSPENKGMSLSEIYKAIQELYPYYKYCADGWQSSVRHNLSLNKAFKKISKEGKGWLWGLDEAYFAEKDRSLNDQNRALKPGFGFPMELSGFSSGFATTNNLKPPEPSIPVTKPPEKPPVAQATKPKISDDEKKILKVLQEQLRNLTKGIKGLSKETVIKLLTEALKSTMGQLQKDANGQSLIKFVEKNPQVLTKCLINSLNSATKLVTNGRMTFKELISGKLAPPPPVKPNNIPLIPLKDKEPVKPVPSKQEPVKMPDTKKEPINSFGDNLNLIFSGEPPKKKRTESLIAFEQNLDRFLAGDGDAFIADQGLSKISESAIDDDDDEDSKRHLEAQGGGDLKRARAV